MTKDQYRHSQRRHRTAEIAVQCAIQSGISLREFIRTALPKLSTNQLRGIQRLLSGILSTRGITA